MTIDPSEIGRHPELIKKAQTEMAQSDVLVCGKCHEVFHFIDLFKEHKDNNCKQISTLKDCRETKPKVWAFLLWKASQLHVDENSNVNAWKLYQTWIKLEESIRETWLVAGRTIQSFARFGNGAMQEMPVKITRTVVESEKKVTPTQQNFAKRVLPAGAPKPGITNIIKSNLVKRDDSMMDAEEELSKIKDNPIIRKVEPVKPSLTAKPTILANKVLTRSAIRTLQSGNETEERDIEKILAKRFNPRKKGHEYLIKWSNLTQDSNTWEPLKHIEECKDLLDIFETQLAKQKEQRAKLQDSNSTTASTVKTATTPSMVTSTPNRFDRPIRFSKAKAIDQVKQWVTSSHHHEKANTSSEKKRKYDDSDFDVADEEEDSDFDKRKNKSDPIVKRLKADSAVNEALIKAGSTGNVRIMTKSGGIPAGTTLGATTVKKIITKPSSDVIITNDQKKSGVFKKTVVPLSQTKVGEGQVKIINKSDTMTSGIVRISSAGTSPVVTKTITRIVSKTSPNLVQANQQKPIVRTVQTTSTTKGGTPVQKQIVQRIVQKPGQTPSPNVRIVQKQVVGQTPVSRVQSMNIPNRSSMSPKPVGSSVTTISSGGGTITRRVTVPVGKPSPQPTMTKKIIQGQPTGGVTKVIRKVVSSSGIVRRRPADEEDEIADPFPKDLPSTNAPPSPPRPLTLCPITGEVLGKAEGEKSPDLAEETSKVATNPPGKAIIRGKPNEKSAAAKKAAAAAAAAAKESEAQASEELHPDQQQIHQFLANEDGSPIYMAGEDGTIYQVAGKNANGETILISQGSDGEQQCVLLSADQDLLGLSGLQTEEGSALTVDAAVAEAVAIGDQLKEDTDSQEASSDATQPLSVTVSGDGDSQDGQITAEIVQADMPSPGGTRKVVLLLPDGSLMMTDVSDEQFQSLNIQNQE